MTKIDKYKIAAEMKRNDPTMTHKRALELAKIAEELYLEDNYQYKDDIAKVKEMIDSEGSKMARNKMVNSR